MTSQDNEILLNGVLIQMACSFLQYVSECSPWVAVDSVSDEAQVNVLAARQRQDVAEIAALLDGREHYIDFGSFPTEYTDQQFLSLQSVMGNLKSSHELVCRRIGDAIVSLRAAGDLEGAALLTTVESHERDILRAMNEIQKEMASKSGATG
ncbi:MAG TPA: hypothetical protein PLY87_02235 [Planctomycetaceae bacterium]|nr:hypothetical protein [Planctomycetaceae bacterium]HQZ63860.1 hypothetical protein [Planctomycetaceae bacterium]HRA87233.1 hypothetical protein [Planctomycetaceae bacterium]